MGVPERNSLHDQVFGHVRRQGEAVFEGPRSPLGIDLDAGDQLGQHIEDIPDYLDRRPQGPLILLHVPVIGQGEALDERQKIDKIAYNPGRAPSHQFEDVGVLFLGHHAGAGAECVGKDDPAELAAVVDHQVLGHPAGMDHQDRHGVLAVQQVIPVGYRVQAVVAGPVEAEHDGGEPAVEGKRGPRQGPAPQGTFVDRLQGEKNPAKVPGQGPEMGQPVVSHADRLGLLEVGVARHDDVPMSGRPVEQGVHEGYEGIADGVHFLSQVEPDRGGSLVVAAPPRVELGAQGTDEIGEPRLDIHVDVFHRFQRLETALLDLAKDLSQAVLYHGGLALFEQPHVLEHPHVGDAPVYIVRRQPPV